MYVRTVRIMKTDELAGKQSIKRNLYPFFPSPSSFSFPFVLGGRGWVLGNARFAPLSDYALMPRFLPNNGFDQSA